MRQRLEQLFNGLKVECAQDNKTLLELKNKQETLRETMLSISGAIKALEEELTNDSKEEK